VQSKLRKKGGRLYACFVDFSQAFDSIPHRELWVKMHRIGIPRNIIRVVQSIYSQAGAQIRTSEGLTKKFKISKGVLQGETLSLVLFSIYINDIIEYLKTYVWMPIKLGARTIIALLYADDMVLLAPNPLELQRQLLGLEEYAKEKKKIIRHP